MSDWVLLARLVRPQGRKGEIIADIYTDFPDRFAAQPRVFLGTGLREPHDENGSPLVPRARQAIIERHWLHQGRIVFKFQGIDSINDADALRGLEVVVPSAERVPLADDAVYIGDLVGCRIVDLESTGGKQDLGEVVDVVRGTGGAPDLLVVCRYVRAAAAPDEQSEAGTARPRRGKRAKKLPELLIPFAKKYLVSVDVAKKRIEMRLPVGLAELNSTENDGAPEAGEA